MAKEKNQKEELNEKLEAWIRDNIPEDEEEKKKIMNWAKVCGKHIFETLDISLDEPAGWIAIYTTVIEKIIEQLAAMRSKHSQYAINIADVVEIGYDDGEIDDDEEKQGNFSPYIFDLEAKNSDNMFEISKEDIDSNEETAGRTVEELSPIEKCTCWNSNNIKYQANTLNKIATEVMKTLGQDIDIHLGNSVVVFPIFTICHQQLREYMKLLQYESGSSSEAMDICGIFTVYAHLVEEGEVAVEYKPDPSHKLATKSDATATARHDDDEDE